MLTAQAQSRQSVGLRQTGHELANKSSKIVPLGAPLSNCYPCVGPLNEVFVSGLPKDVEYALWTRLAGRHLDSTKVGF